MKRQRRLRKLAPDAELIRRRAAGETSRALAPEYGVSHSALGRYFARPELAKQLREELKLLRAEQRAAQADQQRPTDESASKPCPASDAEPCLQRPILLSVLPRSPDEEAEDEDDGEEHDHADDDQNRELHPQRITPPRHQLLADYWPGALSRAGAERRERRHEDWRECPTVAGSRASVSRMWNPRVAHKPTDPKVAWRFAELVGFGCRQH